MNQLIKFFLKNGVAANLLALFLILTGILAGQSLVVRLFPEVNLYTVNITVPYPGASPTEVEEGIVEPIEQQIEGLEGIRQINSIAAENLANIVVELNDGEDVDQLLNDIRTEISQITVFPQAAEEPRISELESEELIAQVIIAGPLDTMQLKRLADEARGRLVATEAISRATIAGVPDYLIDISVPEPKLQSLGLSLTGLARTVASESLELSGGEIEGSERRTLVRTLGESETGAEFSDIVVATSAEGTPVRLGDIGEITDGLAESPVGSELDGEPAVALNIYRVGDEKVFDIIAEVEAEVETLNETLPGAATALLWENRSDDLQSRINLLQRNALIGLALVFVLLLLFLDIRIAFWVAVGVGISFIGALILMQMFGVAISQLSLFGFILAIGIVVDDAIVVGENIYANREKGYSGREAAERGVLRVARPVLFSVTTTIVAFLPLIFLPGVFGQFLGAIASVVIFVLFLSLVESFLILPRHLSHLSDKEPGKWSPRRYTDPVRNKVAGYLDGFSEKRLRPGISFATRRPFMSLMVACGALIATFGLLAGGFIKFIFFPAIEGNFVTAEIELAEAASESQTRAAADQILTAVDSAAETIAGDVDAEQSDVVEGVFFTLGQSLSAGGPGGQGASGGASANRAFLTARIQDAAERNFTAAEFEAAWREAAGEIPGAQTLSFSSDLTGAEAAVSIDVSGPDEGQAREVVAKLREELTAMEGTLEIRDDRFRTTDEVQVSLLPQARAYGLTLEQVAAQVRGAYFGAEAVRIQRDREEIEVRVRYTEAERSTLATIRNQRLFVDGAYVPLSAVAEISIGDAPSIINRKDGRRVFSLTADVDTAVTTGGTVTGRLLNEIWPEMQEDYPEVTVEPGGEQAEQGRAQSSLATNFLLALFVIYALLALVFGSYSQPIVVMGVIPFGLIGALLGHAMLGIDLTLLSLFGVIGLSGVIINDALLIVDYINEALDEGKDPTEAIIDSGVTRFRPILLTSMTTFLGVTPIILEQSVQAAFLVPTAVALGFGILFGTLILMFLVPAIAALHLRGRRLKQRLGEKLKQRSSRPSEQDA